MKSILAIFFSLVCLQTFASDTIVVIKDNRLDILEAKQAAMNRRATMMTSTGQYKGFRIQVVSTSNREEAFKIKSDLLNRFRDQKSYVLFQSPNFKVRIGNFILKDEAEKFRKQIAKSFKQGIYVVEDIIEYTPPAEEDL